MFHPGQKSYRVNGREVTLKIRLMIAALFLASSFQALPAMADEAATVADIRSAALELDKAYADEDVSTIERMILPDHVSIAPRYGGAASPTEQVASFDQLERDHFDYSPIDIALLAPDIALVTFEKSYTGTFRGKALPPRVFVSQIWLKQDDSWRQRLYQETAIVEMR
jgi:ketosteroid isomerase-like protein